MPQSVQELAERVKEIAYVFNSLLTDPDAWNSLGLAKQQQLTTGINKSYGQAMSFLHEYTTTRAAELKSRAVVTQTHADVSVGEADALFAKSVECKSVTKPEKGAVNKIIGDALEQLGGVTGHHPRDGDVRIIDVKISGTSNPWPLAGGIYGTDRAPELLATIQHQAVLELNTLVHANKTGANAIRAWLAGETFAHGVQSFGRLRDTSQPSGAKGFPHSTRPIYAEASGQIHKIRCLTIKVRYEPHWILSDPAPPGQVSALAELVMQVYRQVTGGLQTETAKRKTVFYDLADWQILQVVRS